MKLINHIVMSILTVLVLVSYVGLIYLEGSIGWFIATGFWTTWGAIFLLMDWLIVYATEGKEAAFALLRGETYTPSHPLSGTDEEG